MKTTTKHNNYGNVVFFQNYQSITYKTLFCISHFRKQKETKREERIMIISLLF